MGVCEGVLGMGSVGVRRLESVGVRGYVGESRKALGDNRWVSLAPPYHPDTLVNLDTYVVILIF